MARVAEWMEAKQYGDALRALEEIEREGPLWHEGRTPDFYRAACEAGLGYSDFKGALSADAQAARDTWKALREAKPELSLRAALREAGLYPETLADIDRVERQLALAPPPPSAWVFDEDPEKDLAPEWQEAAAELRLRRAALWADMGGEREATDALATVPPALRDGALHGEFAGRRAMLAREAPLTGWWEDVRKTSSGELPRDAAALHAVLFPVAEPSTVAEGEEAPPPAKPMLAEGDLLPILRRRATVCAREGRFDDALAHWDALFRLQPDDEAREKEAERVEAFLDEQGENLPRERRAELAALPLDRVPGYAIRDRLSKRLFALFEADTPEATVEALRAWADARLAEGQRREFSYQVANYLYVRDKYREAVEVLSESAAPSDRELLLRALCRLKREENDAAIRDLRALAEEHPASSLMDRGTFTLGWALLVRGDKEEAKAMFQRVATEHPDSDYARQARNFLAQLP